MRADVTLVSPYPNPDQPSESGVAWYTQGLARALTGQGARVSVIAPGHRKTFRTERDGAVEVNRCFSRGTAGAMRAAGAALATGAPVVHVQHEAFLYGGPDSVPSVLMGLARLRRAGRGPVVTMHQVVDPASVDRAFTDIHRVRIPPRMARAGLATIQGSVARIASTVIVHEPAFRRVVPGSVVLPLGGDHSARSAGPDAGSYAGHHSGSDTGAEHHPGPEAEPVAGPDRDDLRSAAGAAPGVLLILCFGFVAPYKGFEAVLEAAQLAGPNVRVVIAGAEHPRLKGHGYLAGLQQRYGDGAFFTGFVPDEEVGAWFRAADAIALPYPQPFSSSGVLALAISHGVAALVSPQMGEVIGLSAAHSIPIDPPAMAEALSALALDRSRLAELAAGTADLRVGRSWEELAERHLELYEEVIYAQHSSRRKARRGSRR